MEAVGGDLNAYTGKEETVYYTAFLKEHFSRAVDLLTDIVFGSVYPQPEMNKEVEVVIDEIESYNDSPAELIFDDFERLVFDGHPLGRNILGEADHLREFKSQDVQKFATRLYRPDNAILFVYGQIEPETVKREVEKSLRRVASSLLENAPLKKLLTENSIQEKHIPLREAIPPYRPQKITVEKNTHQAHVMIGCRAYSAKDPRHIALYLLNNILGGPGMNSRLNLSLREKNGLVYSVESNMTCYTDTGVWSIYFGCDEHDVARCQRLVANELKKLTAAPMSETALAAAKRQIKGQIGISGDNFESMALAMGKTFLHYDRPRSIEKLYGKIDALTADELHKVACELFAPENLTTLIYK